VFPLFPFSGPLLGPSCGPKGGAMSNAERPTPFPLGKTGACESTLFAFFGRREPKTEELEVERVAARELHEAVTHMQRWHREFKIERLETLGMIELVSGSALD